MVLKDLLFDVSTWLHEVIRANKMIEIKVPFTIEFCWYCLRYSIGVGRLSNNVASRKVSAAITPMQCWWLPFVLGAGILIQVMVLL